MKKLDNIDTVRLMIAKNWEIKGIPKKKEFLKGFGGESIESYSKRVFAKQCGISEEDFRDADVNIIWVDFAKEFFEIRELHQFMELVTLKSYTPVRAIIVTASLMKVTNLDLDESDIKKIKEDSK